MTLGERIRAARNAAGMSQEIVEYESGIKREYLSKLESGKLPNTTIKTLKKLSDAMGVTLASLVDDGGPGKTLDAVRNEAKDRQIANLQAMLFDVTVTLEVLTKRLKSPESN